jgi:hypothetical protein
VTGNSGGAARSSSSSWYKINLSLIDAQEKATYTRQVCSFIGVNGNPEFFRQELYSPRRLYFRLLGESM